MRTREGRLRAAVGSLALAAAEPLPTALLPMLALPPKLVLLLLLPGFVLSPTFALCPLLVLSP